MRDIVESKISARDPDDICFSQLHKEGIPIEIGAFGHRDRAQNLGGRIEFDDDFNDSSRLDFRGRFKSQTGDSQTFRGGKRTDPKPREGDWSENK